MLRTLAALAALAPLAALAQTQNLEARAAGAPSGLAVPGLSAATADEATALQVNPAGVGFVGGAAFHYAHEGRSGTGQAGDGLWLAAPVGPLVPALSMEWVRPRDGGGARFRKTTLALALSGGRTFSAGVAWDWYASPDGPLDALSAFDAGLAWRPLRELAVGASIQGMQARLAGVRLPVRYDLGLGLRLWQDRITATGDLLLDDQGRDALQARAVSLGAGLELLPGLGLRAQLQLPVRSNLPSPSAATYLQLALVFDQAHAGVTTALAFGGEADRAWLMGVRLAAERYRSPPLPSSSVPSLDLGELLAPARGLLAGDRDRYGRLVQLLTAIRDDRGVPALAVKIDALPLGQGRVEELRRLLLEVKRRKPVLAYLQGGGMKEYYLASAGSLVVAPPSANLFPGGLASSTPFVKGALDKLGIAVEVVAVGRYKNAPDPLTRTDMGEAQREVANRLLDDLFDRQVKGIAEARGLPEARVRELVDVGVFTAEEARQAKLLDAVAFPDELDGAVSARVGRKLRLADGFDPGTARAAERWGPTPAVALVRLEGTIVPGKSRDVLGAGGVAGGETVAGLVRRAAADGSVKAIVLRIDSPGGDGLASDLVWRAVVQARRKGKPVIVSMGDVAASGGYLAAVGADVIVAEASTLTGSIGVFALKPDLSGLLGKIGVNPVTLKRGESADLQSITRRWTERERATLEREVQSFYELFLSRVGEGRRMDRSAVDRLAGGQVWTGAQALERGLVDRLGSLDDALHLAAERAGLGPGDPIEVRRVEPERGFLEGLAGGLLGASPDESRLAAIAARIPELQAAALLLEMGPLIALPPDMLPAASFP
jgi:protease IV